MNALAHDPTSTLRAPLNPPCEHALLGASCRWSIATEKDNSTYQAKRERAPHATKARCKTEGPGAMLGINKAKSTATFGISPNAVSTAWGPYSATSDRREGDALPLEIPSARREGQP